MNAPKHITEWRGTSTFESFSLCSLFLPALSETKWTGQTGYVVSRFHVKDTSYIIETKIQKVKTIVKSWLNNEMGFYKHICLCGQTHPLFRRYPLQIQQLFREVNTHRHFTLGTIAPKLKPWFKGVFAAYFRRCENTTPSRCLARGFLRRQIWWRWQSMAAKQLPKHKAENDFLWSQQHQNTMCLCLFSFREKP